MATERFDAIVIGTGQGGKPLAGEFAKAEWKTAIIERDRVGGSCVISGCTPTKTMYASARVAHLARRAGDYGVRTGSIEIDQKAIRKRKRDIVDMFSSGSTRGMEKWETMDLIMGEAKFVGPHEIEVSLNEGGTRVLESDKIFINVGMRPATPPIEGLADTPFLNSTSLMELGEVPEHLIVLGGGYIGLEFGQMFRRFGAKVTIIEMMDRLLPREDEDIAEEIVRILSDDGISIMLGTKAKSVSGKEGDLRIEIETAGAFSTVEGSHLLVSVGRVSNADRLNLSAAGIETDERGFIRVNERLETSLEGVWALGDVTGAAAFTHVSYDHYRVIAENLLRDGRLTTAGRMAPYVIFIDPQYGRVGMSERDAEEAGIKVRVAKMPMSHVARALEADETSGFIKVIVDSETDRIVGAAVIAVEGGELMSMFQIAMIADLPYQKLETGVLAHPTLAESLNNVFKKLE